MRYPPAYGRLRWYKLYTTGLLILTAPETARVLFFLFPQKAIYSVTISSSSLLLFPLYGIRL